MFKKENWRIGISVLFISSVLANSIHAATPINLAHQPFSILKKEISSANSADAFKELRHHIDEQQTNHIRMQQTYDNHSVWGADIVIHVPKKYKSLNSAMQSTGADITMNGTIYKNIDKDLHATPSLIFTKENSEKILQQTISTYKNPQQDIPTIQITQNDLIVYIDNKNIAHWAYLNSFVAKFPKKHTKPTYIVDAMTGQIYMEWNDIKTLVDVVGGGLGGNEKTGEYYYDGLPGHFDKLIIQRDPGAYLCYLQNSAVTVMSDVNLQKVITFVCGELDKTHNNVFWSGNLEGTNNSYSPDNDAVYMGSKLVQMYLGWYGVPLYANDDGTPKIMPMMLHAQADFPDNAEWFAGQMWFSDGDTIMYYPFVALDVVGHEGGHAFTEQHSNLVYTNQSGGLNESFSDMSAQAIEYFVYGKNSWHLGETITRGADPVRYMENPTKDCNGRKPGVYCSIDNFTQYNDSINPHYTSGIYNKFFYLLSTTLNWSPPQAFKVMLTANMHYWTSTSTFQQAACGAIASAKDLRLDTQAVINAAKGVGIDPSSC
jgi:pseudolysin